MNQLNHTSISPNQSPNLIIVSFNRKAEVHVPKDYSTEAVQKGVRDNKSVCDTVVNLPADFMAIVTQLEGAKEQIKRFDAIKKEAEAKILDAMGDAGKAILPNGCVVTRKLVERKEYQVPACSFITLAVKGVQS